MKVKIIKDSYLVELEKRINTFIEESDSLIRDVKYQDGDGGYSAMILYQNLD